MSSYATRVIIAASVLGAGSAWAAAGDTTPNSTTTSVNVNVVFNGQCYANAFDSQYSTSSWYPAYAQAQAYGNIWRYLYTSFSGTMTLKTTRHGNHGAVHQVDLDARLGGGTYTFGSSNLGIDTYTYASAQNWYTGGYAYGNAGAYGSLYNSNESQSNANASTKVFVKGANITEFVTRVALNASKFNYDNFQGYVGAWSNAAAWSGWPTFNYSEGWAQAFSQAYASLYSNSVVYLDIVGHYKKVPGKNDVQTVVDSVTGYLSCGAGVALYPSAYSHAYSY